MRTIHRHARSRFGRCNRALGVATTETVLVIIPLLLLVGMAPWMAHMFLDLQVARTEAHRDAFDKTTMMLLLPEAFMDKHIAGEMTDQFGAINEKTRRHALAGIPDSQDSSGDAVSPPAIPKAVEAIYDSPGGLDIKFTESFSVNLFDDGFPNATVEGWEYIVRPGPVSGSPDMHFMTYAATLRSTWTWLGYPMVTTQDLIYEPSKMQDWFGELAKLKTSDKHPVLTDAIVKGLKLAE